MKSSFMDAIRRSVAGGVLFVAVTGCATSYQPRANGRIAYGMSGGNVVFIKDGKTYPQGFFGGNLVDLVEDNPEAAEQARAYRDTSATGFVITLVGAAGVTTGVLMGPSRPKNEGDGEEQKIDPVATGVFIGGLAVWMTGLFVLLAAQPHMLDAVNIYNDGVDQDPPLPPGARGNVSNESARVGEGSREPSAAVRF